MPHPPSLPQSAKLGGENVDDGGAFWRSVRDQTHPFFANAPALWRFSIKSTAAPLTSARNSSNGTAACAGLPHTSRPSQAYDVADKAGGHATLFRGGDKRLGIQKLPAGMLAVHKKLKRAFDPQGILGPGRIHADF